MPATQRYRPEEVLTWTRIENEVRTQRRVQFKQYLTGSGQAIVTFGHSAEGVAQRHTVPLEQLSRPQAPEMPWFLPARIEPPKPPTPLTEGEVAERFAARRETLAQAHDEAKAARDAVAYAK